MATLKEIKVRIASVSSTLKITSAMKMVASAKLRKAQQAIGNMLSYEQSLQDILLNLISSGASVQGESIRALMQPRDVRNVAIVAFSSNSALCGAFNSNIIRETKAVINEYAGKGFEAAVPGGAADPEGSFSHAGDKTITVYSVGRKMADAMKKFGYPSPADYSKMSASPDYESAAALAKELVDGFLGGRFDKIELLYNHYQSNSSQPGRRKTYLPMSLADVSEKTTIGKQEEGVEPANSSVGSGFDPQKFIIEPDATSLVADLLPKVIRLRIYTTLLDSSAAEHAARTVAMQTATDNGQELLQDLTLELNKSRQQKITNELLDIVSGSSSL